MSKLRTYTFKKDSKLNLRQKLLDKYHLGGL